MKIRFSFPLILALSGIARQSTASPQTTPDPAFEVTTIKPAQPDTAGPLIGISADRMTLTGFTLKQLMMYGYWVHPDQILTGADWMNSEKFDIVAKPEKALMPQEELRRMLQIMLADRFQLKYHHEQKVLSIYELTLAKGGSKMRARTPGDGGAGFRLVFQGNSLPGRNASITQLIFVLQSRVLDRPVIDKTELSGNFDFDLAWSPDGAAGADSDKPDSDNPDLFTAMQRQLGLKVEARKGPVDVLVIDHAEKPDAN